MDKLNKVFENSELIAKKLTRSLSEEESERFDQWLSSSEENRAFFEKIRNNSGFFAWNDQFRKIDTEKAWDKINEVIAVERKKRGLMVILKYAAAIVLPLIIGASVFWAIDGHKEVLPDISEIRPGMKSALLVLSNGQKIDLGSQQTTALKEADGTIIKKWNDELHYTGQKHHTSDEILKDELVIPRGGEYNLVLSDGTRVFLNSMSRLIFPVRFPKDERVVMLEGEGYFEVQKEEKRPFIVQVNGMQIQVMGTSFNVKAYQDELGIYTTLVEGKVRVNTGSGPNDQYVLEPDQQAVFDRQKATLSVEHVDAVQYIQWTKGKYIFYNQTLDEIMKTLSRWYDFTYQCNDESIRSMRFEGGLNKYESIYPILDIIGKTGKVKVTVKGKEVIFTKR